MVKEKASKKRNKKIKEKENQKVGRPNANSVRVSISVIERTVGEGPMYTILSSAQQNETFHKRYIKEMKQLYSKLDHHAFMYTFIKIFKTVLEADENNEYGNTALAFCAKFVTSFESEKTHPILAQTFSWLLSTISNNPHIRYRICFFVNLILKHLGLNAALDDSQCDQILLYMLDRLKDMAPSVRKEAVMAMQRLQMPDNPNDPVACAYQYHLSSDPSSSVRQCIISCMGRNYLTVPHILQRLWDVDEKVRRHTYINMCNYPVRAYKVSQRLTLLERGLNDSSDNVRKNVIKYMLKAWIESYQHNYVQLTAALKLDSNEEEILRFRRVARQMLFVIFEHENSDELISQLDLSEDCDLHRCVPHEKLTFELVLYWQTLSAYFQDTQADEFELVLPELSVFCDYVKKFCQLQKPDMDKFAQIQFQCMLLSLVEMLETFDLGDEIGRENLKELITHLLKECFLDHKIVCVMVRCIEKLVTDVNKRMQYFIEIIYEICELNAKQNDLVHDRNLIDKLLDDVDTSLVMQIQSLKVKILELEELEENFVRQKEYIRAQAVNDEKIAVTDEYTELIQPLLAKHGKLELPARPKLSKPDRVLKGLYLSFYMVASKHVLSLNPSICKLYKDFICRHLAATEVDIFEWAIKCGTTYSILYEAYTKEVFDVLVDQFYQDNLRICATSAQCFFELMDHYGVDYFIDLNQSSAGQPPKSKRRLLYTMQDYFDGEDERSQQSTDQNTDIVGMMGFYVEKVVDKAILVAIVRGLCRLVLRGQLNNRTDILEKLIKRYFNSNTEPIVNQILGNFFENIVTLKLQRLLQPCLLPILWSIMNSNYESPLHDVVPDHVTKFFIDLTMQQSSTSENNIHNQFALSFLNYIQNYYTERKDMCRLLAKELTTLKLNVLGSPQLKAEIHELVEKLKNSELEPRIIKHLVDFVDILNGSFKPPAPRTDGNESDAYGEECESVTTAASTLEGPPQIAPTTEIESTITSTTVAATTDVASESNTTTPTPASPVLTTYGTNNQVGIRFLRRSLHNSISHSEGDTTCGANTPELETVEKQQQHNTTNEISQTTLGNDKTKARLEEATACVPKSPEKRVGSQTDSSRVLHLTADSISKEAREAVAHEPEVTENPVAEENGDHSSVRETEHDDSEIIEASPTIPSPKIPSNQKRLRSMRNKNITNIRNSPTRSSKRKVLHLEMQTPVRNGRKRLLRISLRATSTTAAHSQSSDSTTPRISPLRKQPRKDARTPINSKTKSAAKSSVVTENSKSTSSPTDSSISSVKENTAPKRKSTHKTPQPSRRSSTHLNSISPNSRVMTRHSARKIRINSMRMTRKRLSLEMTMSEGHLKESTPKRVRQDKSTRAKSSAIDLNTSSSGSRRIGASPRTRAITAENAPIATRTRRK